MLRKLSLALIPSLLSAATDDFRLESYVPADFRRHYLSVSPLLSWEDYHNERFDPLVEEESANRRGSQNLSVRHGSELYARKLRGSMASGLDLSRSSSRSSHDSWSENGIYASRYESSDEGTSYYFRAYSNGSGQWHFRDRYFLAASAEPRIFIRPGYGGRSEHWNLQGYPGEDSLRYSFIGRESDADELEAGINVRAAAGYGRIEDVKFAETALFILDRIRAATGRDIRLSPQEVNALEAYLEGRRKLRPFFDARMASIYDLESVDAFLRGRTGAEALPARAILEMADVWNHSGRHRRESGWELRANPFFAWTWRDYTSRDDLHDYARWVPADSALDGGSLRPGRGGTPISTHTRVRNRRFEEESKLGAALALAYRRPWRRHFQFDGNAVARGSRVMRELGEQESRDTVGAGGLHSTRRIETAYPYLEGNVEGSVAYFPDTRTQVRVGLRSDGWRKLDYLGSKSDLAARFGHEPSQDAWHLFHRASLEAEYFVSPRLSVSAQAEAWRGRFYGRDELTGYLTESAGPSPLVRSGTTYGLSARTSLTYYLF